MEHFFFCLLVFLWNIFFGWCFCGTLVFFLLKKFLCLMFGFVLVLIIIFSVIDVTLQKVETLPSCIGAWRNIWTKITINHLRVWTPCLMHRCVPPRMPPRCFSYPLTLGLDPSVESSKIWHGAFCFTEWTILKEWNALWPWIDLGRIAEKTLLSA